MSPTPDGFEISAGGRVLIAHGRSRAAITVGTGTPNIQSDRGHFQFTDDIETVQQLAFARVEGTVICLSPRAGDDPVITLTVHASTIEMRCSDAAINRVWIDCVAQEEEAVWGCGEQMSYLNLRGRTFPLWTGEPGVGRDPGAGSDIGPDTGLHPAHTGDYWTTYYPQPTMLSSRRYALHIDSTAYTEFDFSAADRHRLQIWGVPDRIEIFAADSLAEIVGLLAAHFGQQPVLPDWIQSGAIVGLKDGQNSFLRLEQIIASGAHISGLWCEDWAGIRETSFGRRLFWDWKTDAERYPGLPENIAALRARGIRFLGYVNPYLAIDGSLYHTARDNALLVLRQDSDAPYLVDFGEFECGLIDLTNSAARDWFIDTILCGEMLDLGMAGWMADFGEYLPVDARLSDGSDPMISHNLWPVLWAQTNSAALEKMGQTGTASFFMRAGHSGIGGQCPLLWAGDQSVDFSRHDGIGTAICAALSAGLMGNAYHHSDIGGYTSLGGTVRTEELLMRWTEMAVFTACMRTHEGNRPGDNLQIDSNAALLDHFARMTRIRSALAPYIAHICKDAAQTGLPLQRALFLHYEDDPICRDLRAQFLFGRDLLVAPVIAAERTDWRVYLPPEPCWIHIWSGKEFAGSQWIDIDAPIGAPPVFYHSQSPFARLFQTLSDPETYA